MSSMVMLTTSIAEKKQAMALASSILDTGLAACVQVSGPVTSLYIWNHERCTETEWLCVSKTLSSYSGRLMEFIRGAHPYEIPEIIVTPVLEVLPEYLEWLKDSLLSVE